MISFNMNEDCLKKIIEFLPAQDGVFVCKHWYVMLIERARNENAVCNFLRHWISRYRTFHFFLNRLSYDINYRLQYLYIHDTPCNHICMLKPLPSFARHVTKIDLMRTEEYNKIHDYLVDLEDEDWQVAFETVVML